MRRFIKRRRWLLAILGLVAVLVSTGLATGIITFSAHVWRHEPTEAALAAEEFADAAFVADDLETAYAALHRELADQLTPDQFRTLMARMHPEGRPSSVRALEFERLPGFRGMTIYLEGSAGDTTFFYRFLMEGTSTSGYTVAGIWRDIGPRSSAASREQLP
jgi:hypothetical protein